MRRLCSLIAFGSLIGVAAPAPAGAATVDPQVERSAPAKFPENLPGCQPRCVRGRTIPRGWVLLSRRVTLDAGERRATVRFRCPPRRVFRTLGFLESGDILIQVPRDQLPYTRRTRLRVSAERILVPLSQRATGTVYALCVPR